jgi:hypothetical protein
MRRLLSVLSLLLITVASKAQLVINEISQGASGNKEFVEFVVVGTRTCADSTMDLRGVMFDDNQGWYGSAAFNGGTYRFANDTAWSRVPYGSIILVYNSAAKNDAIAASDDATDANHDYVYIVPSNSSLLEVNTAQPASYSSTFDYSSAVTGTWSSPSNSSYGSTMVLGNAADVVSVINPSASTTAPVHSVGWGTLTSGGTVSPTIGFPGITSAGVNFFNTGSSPYSQGSWASGSATTPSDETPGAGNTTANSSWISAMRVQVTGPLPVTPGSISGASSLCAGTTGTTYSVAAVSGATGYIWTLPSGWSGTSTTNSITIVAGTAGGTISVAAANSCGSSTSNTLAVTVNAIVTPSVTIASSGTGAVCANTSVTFTPTPVDGGTTPSYSWYANNTLVGTGSSYTANSWSNGDQVFAVMTSSANCASTTIDTSNVEAISVTPVPATPGSITGNTTICAGSSNTYSITAVPDATSYIWSSPSGWSGSSTTNALAAVADNTSGTVSVIANNACGSSAASTVNVTVQATVSPTVSIVTSADTICAGAVVTLTATPIDGGSAPAYQWMKNSTIVGSNSNTYTDNSLANGDVISVILTSNAACATSATANSNSVTMVVNAVQTPSVTIASNTTGTICSTTPVSFTPTPVNGGPTPAYDWYMNGSLVSTGASYTASSWVNGDQVYAALTSNATCATLATVNSDTITITVTPVPATPMAIAGLDTACAGTSQTYSIAAVPDATSYTWTLPGGWSGTSATDMIAATTDTTSGVVSVTASNACGTSAASTLNVFSKTIPAAPGTITGNTSICAGSTNSYTTLSAVGADSYSWNLPSGWSIATGAGMDSITATSDTTSGTISVAAVNACGTSAASTPLTVSVAPVLIPAIGITANPGTQICAGTPVIFTALDTNGGSTPSYQWIKNGANVGTNTSTYTDNGIVAGDQISVKLTSNAICASSSTATSPMMNMSILPIPATPNAITGNNSICPNSTNTYSIAPVAGATSYIWTVPAAWSGTSTTSSITTAADATIGSVTVLVAAENACGASADTLLTVTVNPITTPSVSIAASASTICKNASVTFTASPTNGGATPAYQWLKNGVNIAGATGSTYTTTTLANLDSISVDMASSMPCSQPLSAASNGIVITVDSIPNTPTAINGNTNPCVATTEMYDVAAISNASSYTWTVPGGWSGSSTSDTISAVAGSNNGYITVTASNSCGTSPAKTLFVSVNQTPAQPGLISGITMPCVGSSQTYSIAAMPYATSYNWTMPGGWTFTTNGDSATTIVANASGDVTVTASNACGTSTATLLAVTPVVIPPAASAIAGKASVCVGATETYTVTRIPGFSYVWSAPAGWTGSSNGDTIVYTTGSAGGTISVSLTGSCGTGTAATLAVNATAYVTSSASISTAMDTICSGVPTTFSASAVNGGTTPTYQWLVNNAPTGISGPTYTTNGLNSGDAVTAVLISSLQCVSNSPATSNQVKMTVLPSVVPGINVNVLPGATGCQGSPMNFVSNIKGGGTTPVYRWYLNGTIIPGAASANYSTSSLNNGDSITAVLISSDACPTMASAASNKVGVKITPIVSPTITIGASPAMPVQAGTPVTFTASYSGGGNGPVFQWKKNNTDIPGETGVNYTAYNLKEGDVISVQMLSDEPCPSQPLVLSNSILFTSRATGLSNTAGNWNGAIRLYPNPSNGHFSLDVEWGAGHNGEHVQVDLINAIGQSVYSTELQPARDKWSLSIWLGDAVANGVYQLRLQTDHMQAIRPVMIQR